MGLLKQAEDSLAGLFKGAPKLSDSTKETVVNIWPWLALVGGIVQILAAINLWRWARVANDVADFYRAIGVDSYSASRWSIWVWVALAMLVVEGVLLLIAFPKLKNRAKSGWDILLLVGLLNIVYAIVGLFMDSFGFGGGFGGLLMNVIASAIAFWLLFAVRDKYKGGDFSMNDVTGKKQ
jgi:hypothetical protein